MFIEKITIKNLFSYRDSEFILSKPSDKINKNVALISGRNGFGKTSFLNSIKLLFHGPTEELCAAVSYSRSLTVKQYIVGRIPNWMGILNQHARAANEYECWIEIEWRQKDELITARRSWNLKTVKTENVKGEFTIKYNSKGQPRRLSGNGAQGFINEIFPVEFLSFFFFDGEQISELAESNDQKRSKYVEKILAIDHIDRLVSALVEVSRGIKREIISNEVYEELDKKELDYKKLKREQSNVRVSVEAKEGEIEELEETLKQLRREKDVFFQRRTANDSRNFEEEERRIKQEEKHSLENWTNGVSDLPLVANPELLQKCCEELAAIDQDENSSQRELLLELKDSFPDAVFESRPHPENPDERLKQFYKKRLLREFNTRFENFSDLDDSFFQISQGDARSMLALFGRYLGDPHKPSARTYSLTQLIQCRQESAALARFRVNHHDFSKKDEVRLTDIEERIESINQDLGEAKGILRELKNPGRIKSRSQKINKLKIELKSLQSQITKDGQLRLKEKTTTDLCRFFKNHKTNLRHEIGATLEKVINSHFQKIMTSHTQIHKITFDYDTFTWSYQGQNGTHIGNASISSGMKQLVSTAIIWALQEVSGRELPIIIDTPLARIDRGHQMALLKHYYPSAGRQVIILPTDSEVDEKKYQALAPYIYLEYILCNSTGDNTEPKRGVMYESDSSLRRP